MSKRSATSVLVAAVSFAIVLVGLAVAGWQLGWPSAVFGVKTQPVGLIVPQASNSEPSMPPVTSSPVPVTPTPAPSNSIAVVTPPPVDSPPPVSTAPEGSGGAGDPASVVTDYFAAINAGDYEQAWTLGGDNTGAGTLASFESGFGTTANDTVQIVSVDGDVVTADLVAQQTDGTVKTFEGTYTVEDGTIVAFDVQQTDGAPTDGE